MASGRIEERCRDRIRLIKSLDPNKDFILGELGIVDGKTDEDKQPNVFNFWYGMTMADAAIQLLRGGCAGFIAWYLDDSMHFLGDGDVVVRDCSSLPANAYELRKVWGLWNSLGGQHGDPGDEQLRPWFYTWSLLSRFFPAGCEVVECRVSNNGEQRVAAACVRYGEMQHVSLAIVSYVDEEHTIGVTAIGAAESLDLAVYEYFDCDDDNRVDTWSVTMDEQGADLFPSPIRWLKDVDLSSEIDIAFPGKGVVILTSMEGDDPLPLPLQVRSQ